MTAAEGPAAEASGALIARKEELARAITARLYAALPELDAKYGEYGRGKCLEDMRYNLEHLAPAVALRSPAMFSGYARWLGELLGARGIPTDETVLSLRLTMSVLDEELTRPQAAAVRRCIQAGVTALGVGEDG